MISQEQFLQGLDMQPTVCWYRQHQTMITQRIARFLGQRRSVFPRRLTVNGIINLEVTLVADDIHRIVDHFPQAALDRSLAVIVRCKQSLWFSQESQPDNLKVTSDLKQSISPTSVVPSYVDYLQDINELFTGECAVELYCIPPSLCESAIRQIILIEGLIHEIGHTIVVNAWTERHGALKYPDGSIHEAEAAIFEFGRLVEGLGCGPISHYSSSYWKDDHSRLVLTKELDGDKAGWQSPIQEELVESIAAYLLGFSFCEPLAKRSKLGLDPFADRPTVRDWVDQFLHATVVA